MSIWLFSINLSIGGTQIWLELNLAWTRFCQSFFLKTLLNKILVGGKFLKETYIDPVSLWVLGDPWCDGVAEHKTLYIDIFKK